MMQAGYFPAYFVEIFVPHKLKSKGGAAFYHQKTADCNYDHTIAHTNEAKTMKAGELESR